MRPCLAAWLVAAATPAAAASSPPSGGAAARAVQRVAARTQIAVEMRGFRSDRGEAVVALFASARGFPDRPERAIRRVRVPIRRGAARAIFGHLQPGTYAVAVLHDEDGDHRMKTGFLGIPKEGYGASRDARGRFGPPHFDDARLALRAGQTLRAPITLVYH